MIEQPVGLDAHWSQLGFADLISSEMRAFKIQQTRSYRGIHMRHTLEGKLWLGAARSTPRCAAGLEAGVCHVHLALMLFVSKKTEHLGGHGSALLPSKRDPPCSQECMPVG